MLEGRRAWKMGWICVEKILAGKKNENGDDFDSGEKPKVLGRCVYVPAVCRRPRDSVV
jgi:hypothetical protein